MTATPLAAAAIAQLEAEGVDTVIGTVVNPAGLTQAKTVPIRRTNTFANPGLGASPVWHTFCIDQCSIAFTADISVVGDQRLRIDLSALRIIGDGLAWAPAGFFEQDGTPVPACSRGTLSRIEAALADAGIDAVIGHEVEFLLVDADGQRLPSTLWAQYGVAGVLEHEAFVRDVNAAATAAGIAIEQFHPEYGANQFEISLAPQPPVAAADQLVLTRLIIGRTARRHGLRVSLSPAPFAGSIGSGAHQHFSQFHVGFGDRDADLHKANPLYLLDFLRQSGNTPIVLLHCYPYEREAGYLAQAFNNVYLDGGLSVHYLGARSPAFIGRLLELAPFRKIVYSSDGFGPAELHFLGATLWRSGIQRVLRGFVERDDWCETDALRVVDLIAHGTAARIYRLGDR